MMMIKPNVCQILHISGSTLYRFNDVTVQSTFPGYSTGVEKQVENSVTRFSEVIRNFVGVILVLISQSVILNKEYIQFSVCFGENRAHVG